MSDVEGRYLGQLFVQEVPSGAVDGSNVTFTTSLPPASNSALIVALDGQEQIQGTDYTVSNQTITMTVAPAPGQVPSVSYMKRTL